MGPAPFIDEVAGAPARRALSAGKWFASNGSVGRSMAPSSQTKLTAPHRSGTSVATPSPLVSINRAAIVPCSVWMIPWSHVA